MRIPKRSTGTPALLLLLALSAQLAGACASAASSRSASSSDARTAADRLDVRMVADEAEAVLALLDARAADETPSPAAWERLFESEGYRRLKAREASLGRDFTDDEFREFVLSDDLLRRGPALRATLSSWLGANIAAAAGRAFHYLPADAVIRAKVYPTIKPRPNSFVTGLATDPAIFLYLDPEKTAAQFENVVVHELHHIGYAGTCRDPEPSLPVGVRGALDWMSGFGEGIAMLAAAGASDVHPHATSPAAERGVWDRDVARVGDDLARMEAFFLDIVNERIEAEAEETVRRGVVFLATEDVPQGVFYTVGWHMAALIEQELGRERLVASLCDPAQLLRDYDRAAAAVEERTGRPQPRWSAALLHRLAR
jgi:hypothetical protein